MPTPTPDEAEILALLAKTSLPTLLVEGTDDVKIYRWLENQLGVLNASILQCGGREMLISIFRQRAKFPHVKFACLADRDMWIFESPPADLSGIIFTTGYSIENDLYAGSQIESLLDATESAMHGQLIAVVARWFAFEVEEYLAGSAPQCDMNISQFVDFAAMDLILDFVTNRGFREPDPTRLAEIRAEFRLQLRGKNLIESIVRFLNAPGRDAKYRRPEVIEICLKLHPENHHIQRLVDEARAQLL